VNELNQNSGNRLRGVTFSGNWTKACDRWQGEEQQDKAWPIMHGRFVSHEAEDSAGGSDGLRMATAARPLARITDDWASRSSGQ
jgi:hypothetical protein